MDVKFEYSYRDGFWKWNWCLPQVLHIEGTGMWYFAAGTVF